MSEFFLWNPSARALPWATPVSPLSTRNVIVVPLPPLLEPSEPALQAVRASEATATPVTIAQERRLLPSFIASSRREIRWVGWGGAQRYGARASSSRAASSGPPS